MKKILIFTVYFIVLQMNLMSSANANMLATWHSWAPSDSNMPNTFHGKLTGFNFNPGHKSVIADLEDSKGLMMIEITEDDVAFGATLHSAVGKNIYLIINSDNIVTQFSVLYKENHWYQSVNGALDKHKND